MLAAEASTNPGSGGRPSLQYNDAAPLAYKSVVNFAVRFSDMTLFNSTEIHL